MLPFIKINENTGKMEKYKKALCFTWFFLAVLCIIISFVNIHNIKSPNILSKICISPEKITFLNYSVEGTTYTCLTDDSQLQLPPVNTLVYCVSLKFEKPLTQDIFIQFFYSNREHGYSEQQSVIGTARAGKSDESFILDANVADMRIDIGNKTDTKFRLSSVLINDINLAAEKISERIMLKTLQSVVIMLAGLFVIAVFFVITIKPSIKKENFFLILAIGLGFLYMITITPLSAPDDQTHYLRALTVSSQLLSENNFEVDSAYTDCREYCGHLNVSSAYSRVINGLCSEKLTGSYNMVNYSAKIAYSFCYFPQVTGIIIARLLSLNGIWLYYLGRIFNLAFYVTVVYFAIKKIPRYKTVLLLCAIIPMALHQASSFSYDSFINAMAFLLIAMLTAAKYKNEKMTIKESAGIVICALLLTPAKVIYGMIMLLAFLIPRERFGSSKRCWLGIITIFIVMTTEVFLINSSYLPGIATASTKTESINWENGHNYTISFICNNPKTTLLIFKNTIQTKWQWYIITCFGGWLSGLSLGIPKWIIGGIIAIILFAALYGDPEDGLLDFKSRVFYVTAFISIVFLVMLSMFLGWTSDTRTVIEGVQGRYFIPVLPLLFFALSNKFINPKFDWGIYLAGGVCILHFFVFYNILSLTI